MTLRRQADVERLQQKGVSDMPDGKGTYGSKRGRPPMSKVNKKPTSKAAVKKLKTKSKPKPKRTARQLGSGLASGKPAIPSGAGGKRMRPLKKSEITKRKKPM